MISHFYQNTDNEATISEMSKDPTEIGKSVDAVFPTDGAGAGACCFSGPFKPEASGEDVGEDVGEAAEDCGERAPAKNK